jgi:flagellar biosynthetic protein FliR
MPAEIELWLPQFVSVLARVSAALTFVPLPGLRQAALPPRIALAVALSVVLSPTVTMHAPAGGIRTLADAAWNLPLEAAMGLGAGVALGWVLEVFTLGMQLVSIQGGFSYASTIDPSTQADSGVLLVAGQLAAGLLFVCLGWEQEVLGAFAASLDRSPPGIWHLQPEFAMLAARWTGTMVALAFRLAMSAMAFLLLLDLALALLGRTQPQMPLINLALPAKMGATLALIAWQAGGFPAMIGRSTAGVFDLLGKLGVSR